MSERATFRKSSAEPSPAAFDRPGNVEYGEAFRDDNRMEVDVATAQALLNFDDIGGLVEQILAGLEAFVRDGSSAIG